MKKTDLRYRLAHFALSNRLPILVVMALITAFFAVGMMKVEIRTIFSDLFPRDHAFVKVFKEHPNFGSPLTVTLMVKRTDGKDAFQVDTLNKVWRLSRDIDLVPGVDHDQILSIATPKARYTVITPDGIYSNPIMDEEPPKTEADLAEIRRRVGESAAASTFLVSVDRSATLINATFIESQLDYGSAFKQIKDMVAKEQDGQHEIHVAGFPVMTGWIYAFGDNTANIFALTLALMFAMLVVHMRNVSGIVGPLVVSTVSAIWGFGLVGWLGLPVEPLLMVVPLMLIARCFSHCVQATERFYELLNEGHEQNAAAELSLVSLMAPGTLGIFTDVCGLLLVALAPIPAMERFALFTGLWAMNLVPCSVFLTPILLTLLPRPKNLARVTGHDGKSGLVQRGMRITLNAFSSMAQGRSARYTAIGFVLLAGVSLFYMSRIKVGNPVEGTNLLRYDSAFNTAVRQINKNFPGSMTMEVVFEGKEGARIVRHTETLSAMRDLQQCLEASANPPTATLSFADLAPEANRVFNGGNPKWAPLDKDDAAVSAAVTGLMAGTNAKAFLNVTDFEQRNATVSLWYANNKQETVDSAITQARECVQAVGEDHTHFRIRLASGTIALQQSINDTVVKYESRILAALNLVILVGCSLAYRSIVAGLLLLIPVNLANMMLTATMSAAGLGLDVNTLPILAIGIGVGIDYGIYLLTRICEEYQGAAKKDLGLAIRISLNTCGKAIFFTAGLMTIGLIPWYFLSELKFLSDMGLLLVVVMFINMVLALVLLPLLIYLIKPKFLDGDLSSLSESVA